MDFPITVPFLIYSRKTSKILMGKQYFTKVTNVWLASLSKITLLLWAFLSFYKKANCVGWKINSLNNLSFPNLQIYPVLLLKEVFRFTNSPRLLWPPPHLFYCCYGGRVNFPAITLSPPTTGCVRKVDISGHYFAAKRIKCFKGTIIKTTISLHRSLYRSWLRKQPLSWWTDFWEISSTNGMTLFNKSFLVSFQSKVPYVIFLIKLRIIQLVQK